jgi:hypothetical protein
MTSLRTFINKNIFDSIISIATRLWAGWLRNHGWIPSKGKKFISSPNHPTHSMVTLCYSAREKTQVKNECSRTSGTPYIPSWHNSNEPSKNNLVCKRTPRIYNSGFLKFSYMIISLKFQQFLLSAIFLSNKPFSTLNRVWDEW